LLLFSMATQARGAETLLTLLPGKKAGKKR